MRPYAHTLNAWVRAYKALLKQLKHKFKNIAKVNMCPLVILCNQLSERRRMPSHMQPPATLSVTALHRCFDIVTEKYLWHRHDLLGCCHLTGLSCWLTCSACLRRRGKVGTGSSSPLPVSGGSHARLAEYYKYWRRNNILSQSRNRFCKHNACMNCYYVNVKEGQNT